MPIDVPMSARRVPLPVGWLGFELPALGFFALVLRGPLGRDTWVEPRVFFWLVVVGAASCVLAGLALVSIGWRRRLAEVAILATSLTVSAVLSTVHGLTTPAVLYGSNSAIVVSALAGVPVAILAAAPLLLPEAIVPRATGVHWRLWCVGWLALAAAFSAALLLEPNLVPAPTASDPLVYLVVAVSLTGTAALGQRQYRLYRIGRRRASLVASLGFLYLGLSSLVWFSTGPFTLAWWGAHLIDMVAVLASVCALAIAHFRDRLLADILGPVVNRDPLVALELGLTPTVHRFISALEAKDASTREHVVRVGELAMRTGIRGGLHPDRLRTLGLGALLHDVGKLLVPDEILRKPGALTAGEFDTIKQHPLTGAHLLAGSPLLAPAAALVRWHHERADGSGYPDGLTRDQIPLEAAIISVCDGWDAMTYTRHYRDALEPEATRGILADGADRQWDARAVRLLLEELDENGPVEAPVFGMVGRSQRADRAADDVCAEALPDRLRAWATATPLAPSSRSRDPAQPATSSSSV